MKSRVVNVNLASKEEVLEFISLIRSSVPNSIDIFTKGNCTSFARILSVTFKGGTVYHNIDHAVYEYRGYYYDITGQVEKPKGALPIAEYGEKMMKSLMTDNHRK